VPQRILIDLTLPGTNSVAETLTNSSNKTTHVESATRRGSVPRVRPVDNGKPTRPVGIDRWNPGIY
jgi:hypothetical protein